MPLTFWFIVLLETLLKVEVVKCKALRTEFYFIMSQVFGLYFNSMLFIFDSLYENMEEQNIFEVIEWKLDSFFKMKT